MTDAIETLARMLEADYTGLHPHEEDAIRAAIALVRGLRALEIELRRLGLAVALESQDKNLSEWVRDRAHGRSAGLHEAANRIQHLIAELGQEPAMNANKRSC